jgi:hypothetical protein
MMVSSAVPLDFGGPPELRSDYNHCALQHAAIPEIGHESRDGSIELIGKSVELAGSAMHGIPISAGFHFHVADAFLYKSTSE